MAFTVDTGLPALFGTGDIVAKSARTVTGNSGWVKIGDAKELIAQLDADAGTGTSPTLDVKLQTSWNGTDATAVDVPTGAFTQVLAAASAQIKSVSAMHGFVKVVWTITGTTPSFAFGVYITSRK